MRTYILYLFAALLALAGGPARAQQKETKPPYPGVPENVTLDPGERGGTIDLSPDPDKLGNLTSGTPVTITATPKEGFVLADGYPKVYQTGDNSTTVKVTDNTFTVPNYPFTVEAKFVSTDATLQSLSYQVGDGTAQAINLTQETQTISLPYGTNMNATITLTAKANDEKATITGNTTVTLNNGTGFTTLTVTAEDGETETYTVTFTVKVLDLPVITTQPQNASVYAGDPIAPLTVEASPVTGATLSYQWYSCTNANKDNTTKIANATSSTYTPLANEVGTFYYFCRVIATATDDATYSLFADSDVATVEVKEIPTSRLTLTQPEHGTIQAMSEGLTDEGRVPVGARVELSAIPNSGYRLSRWSVTDASGEELPLANNCFTMPDSDVTVTAEFLPKPTEETPDDPSYTYTLHFEPNDSVRLTADWPIVEEGYSFTFTAEVAEGYDPATLAVEYKEGWYGTWKRLKPAADGITFCVPSVYSDIYVRATVLPIGHPTGVETVTEEVQVYTAGGTLFVRTPCKERVTVVAITGQLVSAEEQIGLRSYIGLPTGIYAIRIGDRLFKAHLR
ncbi:InlB B-repeat-containing protein [Parabacteroides sp.]